ncbi:MAG: PspC domain-containing protein [Acidobacteria bacterium]|nr:PspC domain-containing protein [Acidobacteriota bacterium]MCZ6747555.1 PspC domain-containing protein [Acidobacteriota bacterium]
MARRLTRNTRKAILGGVAAGFGDYIDMDPVLIRLIFIILCLAGGAGLIIYIVAWLVMPRDDQVDQEGASEGMPPPADQFANEVKAAGERVVDNIRRSTTDAGRGRVIGGLILMLLGFLFLMNQIYSLDWLRFRYLWPLVLVGVGVMLFIQGMKGREE